ncbi:MAG: FAD-dependent oxidoreductase [Aureispira sp.]|nr:FAD-dependent oxidoreductase [Aureispira sp.]
MQRRDFLKTASNLSLTLIIPPFLSACTKKDEQLAPNGKTVIVVGAGISGLAAAHKLQQKGFTVLVLEAQNKVGGRICTDRSLGFSFDKGASWIHGIKRNPITALAKEAGIESIVTDDEDVEIYDKNGKQYTDKVFDKAEAEFRKAVKAVRNAGNTTDSFKTVLNNLYPNKVDDELWKYMLSVYLEFDTSSDIAVLSSGYFDDDDNFNGADCIATNGYDLLTNYISKDLDIQLNTTVKAIDYSNSSIKVTANGKALNADYVLVSVPLGVLQNNIISFSPSLPTPKLNAIDRIKMGTVNKFILVWPSVFWDKKLQYIGFTPNTKGKFNYFLNVNKYSSNNALMTFAFGDYALATESMTDSEIINEIMTQLRTIYGSDIPEPSSLLRTKWAQQPHTFGAYSFVPVGATSSEFDYLAEEIENKLFFAGEHTEREYRGTVHGAYLSGIREADKIVDLQ